MYKNQHISKDKALKYDKECREDLLAFFNSLKPVGRSLVAGRRTGYTVLWRLPNR